jgi:capsid portal protein
MESGLFSAVSEDLEGKLATAIKSFASPGPSPQQGPGDLTPPSAIIPVTGGRQMDAINAWIPCRFSIEGLSNMALMSNGIQRLLDAMSVNLHGSGYRFEEKIKLHEPDIDDRLREQIFIEKAWKKDAGYNVTLDVSIAEIEAMKQNLRAMMPLELARLKSFFGSCSLGSSFTKTCLQTEADKEGCGNAGWEIIRRPSDTRHNPRGAIARINYMAGHTIRLRKMDDVETPILVREPVTDLFSEEVIEGRRFRVFGHWVRGFVKYFKEFGDPRMVSQETGEALLTPCLRCVGTGRMQLTGATCLLCAGTGAINPGARMRRDGEPLANEIFHWKIDNPLEEYGLPRWIGCFYEAAGSIESSFLNHGWFKGGMFNIMMLKAWGINVGQAGINKLNEDLEKLRGSGKQGGFLLVEGQPSAGSDPTKMFMDVSKLDQGRGDDGLYQKYDQNNREKLQESFRLPELLLGKVKNTNRATAIVELQMAEQQVFGPPRGEFDHVMNFVFLPEMGVKYHKFVSNGPMLTDPDQLARTLDLLSDAGFITPGEGRELTSGVIGKTLPKLQKQWMNEPLTLMLAKLQNLGNLLKTGYTVQQALAALGGEDVGAPNLPAAAPPTKPAAPASPAAPTTPPATPVAPAPVTSGAGATKSRAVKRKLGLDDIQLRLEYLPGDIRFEGKPWATEMKVSYGYIARTEADDGEGVDVYLARNADLTAPVYLIEQMTEAGEFDETKVMMGYSSMDAARESFLDHMPLWALGTIRDMNHEEFREYLNRRAVV